MANKKISEFQPAPALSNSVVAVSDAAGTITNKVALGDIAKLANIYSVFDLGSISNINQINFGSDRLIQTLSLNGSLTTFNKGTGWPSVNNLASDVVLNIEVFAITSIVWNIVTNWIVSPPLGGLSTGTHVILLRAIGSSKIQGYYVNS
jgi:hypothetical protein